jgi:hypothetical protein
MSSKDSIKELEKYLKTLPIEDQRRILYVLDYILNYFTGDRRCPVLIELRFFNELQTLKQMGIVKEEKRYWRGNSYDHLSIANDILDAVKKLLEEQYYPTITEEYIKQRIEDVVRNFVTEATELWGDVVEFDANQYTLMGFSRKNYNLVELGKELSKNEVGYLIDYWTSSWSEHCKDFIFRKYPVDARKMFIEVVEEEINRIFTSFSPVMRWCLYLRYLVSDADKRFILKNMTSRFLPREIEEAIASLPSLKIGKAQDVQSSLIEKERERIERLIKTASQCDQNLIAVLQVLILFGEEKEKVIEISKYKLDKIKEVVPQKLGDVFQLYIEKMREYGIVLETNYGDLLVPIMVKDVLTTQLKGSVEVKIFESELDGQAFIEEEMAKATSSIKIWDPYVSTKTLRLIKRSVRQNIQVKILSSLPEYANEILNLKKKGYDISAVIVYNKEKKAPRSPFHDRYLIIDDKTVWHFGPSLHGAGEKEYESAVHLPENAGKLIIDAFNYNFFSKQESEWGEDFKVVKI